MPKIVDHHAYRTELLEGAVVLFGDRGYAELSMRTVAEELGVSTGTLYHYFSSKQDLFLRLIEHLTDLFVQAVADAVSGATPRARLRSLLDEVATNEDWYARYNRLCLDHLRQRHHGGEQVMAATMARCEQVVAHTLRIDEAAARFALVALFGLVTQRNLDGNATSFAEQAEQLLSWFAVHESDPADHARQQHVSDELRRGTS